MQFSKLIINDLSMNIDPSRLETSDQSSAWNDNLLSSQNLGGDVRSFRCTFCKRGFSNAQALGGHMNIHRRDRAKLKEFSRENLLSLDIDKDNTYSEDSPDPSQKFSCFEKEKTPHKDDVLHEGLPLFLESPSVRKDDDGVKEGKYYEKTMMEMNEKELFHAEIDLELRLGPEPHEPRTRH